MCCPIALAAGVGAHFDRISVSRTAVVHAAASGGKSGQGEVEYLESDDFMEKEELKKSRGSLKPKYDDGLFEYWWHLLQLIAMAVVAVILLISCLLK